MQIKLIRREWRVLLQLFLGKLFDLDLLYVNLFVSCARFLSALVSLCEENASLNELPQNRIAEKLREDHNEARRYPQNTQTLLY